MSIRSSLCIIHDSWLGVVPALGVSLLASVAVHAGAPFPHLVDPHPAAGNQFGAAVVPLATGNVVVTAPYDDSHGTDTGAVYLFNGATGALISELHGSTVNDRVGLGWVVALGNGNFVVQSPDWDNGAIADAGAVTWGSGISGVSGVVSPSNSLAGGSAGDRVGSTGIYPLTHGHYVVSSGSWKNGAISQAGAMTWCNGTTGRSGLVSVGNSLVGSSPNDAVGNYGVHELANGNYLVTSPDWDAGANANAGAVTWADGASGIAGEVSVTNSLIGRSTYDEVGSSGVHALANGNYVVGSGNWDSDGAQDVGAVTWGNGSTGSAGIVNAGNSLVGTSEDDGVGESGVLPLGDGHYVVRSPEWDRGPLVDAGAATWCDGTMPTSATVSEANSLVGTNGEDYVGASAIALSGGGFVVASPWWDHEAVPDVGAVTWFAPGSTTGGEIHSGNSLVGSSPGDSLGAGWGMVPVGNGNYVVQSPSWDRGLVTDAGAVTWVDGSTGLVGEISEANSLVGSSSYDRVGDWPVTPLSNGNYVVRSVGWDDGEAGNAGAITWGDGNSGVFGPVSTANSLIGDATNPSVGMPVALENGNYVVVSSGWRRGTIQSAGAVTWADGSAPTSATVGESNSLVGVKMFDQIGSGIAGLTAHGITPLENGNYAVYSRPWDNNTLANAGAVTWGDGSAGTSGPVTPGNSAAGLAANTGLLPVVRDDVNDTFYCRFVLEGGGVIRVGSQVDGFAPAPRIAVSLGAFPLSDGGTTSVDVGTTPLGVGVEKTFTITNTGAADLMIDGITKDGPEAAEFAIGDPAATVVAAGGSTTFTVLFSPLATGERSVSLHIGSNVSGAADPFDLLLSGTGTTAAALFESFASNAGLSGPDADPSAIPHGDGVENLLKYAFNMNLAGADSSVLAPDGASGLPLVTLEEVESAPVLRVTFLRRIGSGLLYTPQHSSTLDDFEPIAGTEMVTPIDAGWERVTVEADSGGTARFVRVQVTLP